MKLSIITVNLNNKLGLEKTLSSVICQTFDSYEYIVIDGGSDDGSKKIIEKHKDWLAYFVSESDTGIYHAMNKGIRQSKGQYLLFLNSGDYLVDNTILDRVFELKFDEDVAIGNCQVSEKGKVIFNAEPPDDITLQSFYKTTIPHQAAFIRRSLFDRFGLYSENFKIHSDMEFFLKTIVINNCTYRHLLVTVADYNLEGSSSNPANQSLSNDEINQIWESLFPPRIIKDYSNWETERRTMEALYWFKSKYILFRFSNWLFKVAVKLSRIKKSAFR